MPQLNKKKFSRFFCKNSVGYFACRGETEPRLAGFTKAMAHSRLVYLVETERIEPNEALLITGQIDNSSLPVESNKFNFTQIRVRV